MIKATNIQKQFGQVQVLRGISLAVGQGEIVALIGPSGCGKTTFLRCLNGLETINAGSIKINQLEIQSGMQLRQDQHKQLRISLGMVFQQFHLFPHLSVKQNIMEAPLHVAGLPRADAEARALDLLTKMNLADKANARPRDLSGGQQQRVAIARALAMKPEGLLFDEPTSALDPRMTGEISQLIRQLASEGLSVLVVTHDMGFARRVADRIAVFDRGRISEEGPPEELFRNPQSTALRELLAESI
jgi:polar amino acid transport system ATP-binding protein